MSSAAAKKESGGAEAAGRPLGGVEEELKQLEAERVTVAKDYEAKIFALKKKIALSKQAKRSSGDVEIEIRDSEIFDDSANANDDPDAEGREGYLPEHIDARLAVCGPDKGGAEGPLMPSERNHSLYGQKVSPEEAAELVPPGEGGLVWHAQIISPSYKNPKDLTAAGELKPRRPIPTLGHEDFFSSLTRTADGRWIFSGILNGWPGLTAFEVQSITVKVKSAMGRSSIKRLWEAGKSASAPSFPSKAKAARVTLRAPSWSEEGWSKTTPGFVWWYMAQAENPTVKFGSAMIDHVLSQGPAPLAAKVHIFAHRYARGRPEKRKEKITYHTGVLIEWEHGQHLTVVELATLNGVGGRFGKSNWFDDKFEDRPGLYRNMPGTLISPWKGELAEVRCADVESTTPEQFLAYMRKYTGETARFLDPSIARSADIRLSERSQEHIMRYLINYSLRDRRYTEEFRNCQTFTADFFSFLSGKKDVEPFHAANRVLYQPRQHLFLYEPSLFKFAAGANHK